MKKNIKKYLSGKASETEMMELLDWLDKENNKNQFKNIKNEWVLNRNEQNIDLFTLAELDKFKSKLLNERESKLKALSFTQRFYKYASIILLLLILGGIYSYNTNTSNHEVIFTNTLFAENGQISKALLPDGTSVWLNSGSKLEYNNYFGLKHRNIVLSGQAYFDVTKNPNLPLIVNCDEIDVKVIGTKFTAETYPGQNEIRVVLVEGAVNLSQHDNENTIVTLSPSQQFVYNKTDNKYQVNEVIADKYTSWMEGVIHFYDLPLNEVVAKIHKRFNQRIILSEELEDYKVTFSIRNEDFDDVMDIIKAITSGKVTQKNEIIYLEKDKKENRKVYQHSPVYNLFTANEEKY